MNIFSLFFSLLTFLALKILAIEINPKFPSCGLYGSITITIKEVPENFELSMIDKKIEGYGANIIFSILSNINPQLSEGTVLYANKNEVKLINLDMSYNGYKLTFYFTQFNSVISDLLVVSEKIRIHPYIEQPISKNELIKHGFMIVETPLIKSDRTIYIQLYDTNVKEPINNFCVKRNNYNEFHDIEMIELRNTTRLKNEINVIYNPDNKKLKLTFDESDEIGNITFYAIRSYGNKRQISRIRNIPIENPFLNFTTTKRTLSWDVNQNITVPSSFEIFFYQVENEILLREKVANCIISRKCVLIGKFSNKIYSVYFNKIIFKYRIPFDLKNICFRIIYDNKLSGYTTVLFVDEMTKDNKNQEIDFLEKREIIILASIFILLFMIVLLFISVFLLRKKNINIDPLECIFKKNTK